MGPGTFTDRLAIAARERPGVLSTKDVGNVCFAALMLCLSHFLVMLRRVADFEARWPLWPGSIL